MICCNHTNKIYTHPTDLDSLKNKDRYAKIFIDTIEFNYSIASTALYKCCKFIYLIRNPKQSLVEITRVGYSHEAAISYYLFRLRRMYEMACQTPNGIFLTYEDVLKDGGRKLVGDFIGVKSVPPINPDEEESEAWVPDKGYAKYLAMFRSLRLDKI